MTFTTQLGSLRLVSASAATIAAAALLLTGYSSDGDRTRACPTVHSTGGDLVPAYAARPCIVYSAGHAGACASLCKTRCGTQSRSFLVLLALLVANLLISAAATERAIDGAGEDDEGPRHTLARPRRSRALGPVRTPSHSADRAPSRTAELSRRRPRRARSARRPGSGHTSRPSQTTTTADAEPRGPREGTRCSPRRSWEGSDRGRHLLGRRVSGSTPRSVPCA